VLDGLWFENVGINRVALRGVKALPPPPTTKVGCTALGGYQAQASWFLTGLDIEAKARMLEAQIRLLLLPYSHKYTLLNFRIIGSAKPDSDTQDGATVTFRVFAQAPKAEYIAPGTFLRPIIDNIMQGYPGATFDLDFRQGIPKPYFEYYVTLLPQSDINHVMHFNGSSTTIAPPTKTHTFPLRQPSQDIPSNPVPLTTFGPTERAPLGLVVNARSGDKGSDNNVGFWVRHADEYTWLINTLTIPSMKILLGKEYDESRRPKIEIERFELPNLKGVHFLLRNLLDRGVTSTSSVDFLGKNCAEFLRARWVDVPVRFLRRAKI
jgi:hypothetical protein